MKTKITRIISLILIVTFSFSFLAACSNDELKLLTSLLKGPEVKSSESKTDLTFNLTSEGLPKEDKEDFDQIAGIINGMKIILNQKVTNNTEKTISKSQSDITVDMGGVSVSSTVWTDSDLTGEIPKVKEIIKVPYLLTMSMPSEIKGKSYFVFDTEEMLKGQSYAGLTGTNKQATDFAKSMTPKIMNFILEYAKDFNPGFPVVTRKGNKVINDEVLYVYNLKLDDAAFKKLIDNLVKDFVKNEKAYNLIQELATSALDMENLPYKAKLKAKGEIRKSIEEFKTEVPEFLKTWENIMTIAKDVKILGDKGIDIDFGINTAGNIVTESGTCDFVVNLKEYSNALESYNALTNTDYIKSETKDEGIIRFGVTFNTVFTKINKDVVIDIPKLTEDNSFSLEDYFASGLNYNDFNYDSETEDYSGFTPDTTPPSAPTVNKVLKTSKTLTGKAEAYSIITVKKGENIIGEAMADEKGAFTVNITPVKTKCTLTVTASDIYGNESEPATINVN